MTTFCVADGICVQYLVNKMLREAEQPLYEQNFGLGLMPNDLVLLTAEQLSVPLRCGYLRPWRLLESADSGVSNITHNRRVSRSTWTSWTTVWSSRGNTRRKKMNMDSCPRSLRGVASYQMTWTS